MWLLITGTRKLFYIGRYITTKVLTSKLWQKKAFTIGGECNVIVRDSEPIRLLESPRSLR